MSLYSRGVSEVNALVGPYRARVSRAHAGALDFYKGSRHFYTRGMQVGGFKSSIANFFVDLVQLLLMAGGVYLVLTSIFA